MIALPLGEAFPPSFSSGSITQEAAKKQAWPQRIVWGIFVDANSNPWRGCDLHSELLETNEEACEWPRLVHYLLFILWDSLEAMALLHTFKNDLIFSHLN